MLELYAEDAIFDVSAVFTDVAPVQGHVDIRRYWATLQETWKGIQIEPLEAWDLGNGWLVIDQRMSVEGQRSGAGASQRLAMLYRLRPDDHKAVHARLLPDVETAMSVAKSADP